VTFTLERVDVDSDVLGHNVFALAGATCEGDFVSASRKAAEQGDRWYIVTKLPADEIARVQAAEQAGFRYVETQLRTSLRLKVGFDVSKYPYDYVQVLTEEEFSEVAHIARSTIEHDRFSRDPFIGGALSGNRYERYLRNSFEASTDQIWSVRSRRSGELLTFRSHRPVTDNEVNLLIGGVHPAHKDVGLGVISSHFCFNALRAAGFKKAVTHISASNLPILNLEVGGLNFRVTNTFVVLRYSAETSRVS
jgi:hypothetical protein